MSYKLEKPYTDFEKANFITAYNYELGLKIVETKQAIFALEKNEIIQDEEPVINPNYEQEQAEARKKQFNNEFFQTSLGWIRRKVNMKDGSTKDFLADLLLPIKAGLELGQKVVIITYKTPDFTIDYDEEYVISLQERKEATAEFIQECLMQTVADFGGV